MRALLLMLALLAACQETTVTLTERCDVYLSALAPDAAPPGAPVVATARPLTQTWDTVVHVGGSPAKVDGVSRTDCAECDSCRSTERCSACDACNSCDDVCRDRCVQTVQFTVPQLDPGSHSVSLVNQHGHSTSLPFTVLGPPDTGGTDTALPDSGDSSADSGGPGGG